MGLNDALDSLRMRAGAYAVGTVEFLENIRINTSQRLFRTRKNDGFLGHENPFNNKLVLITGGNQVRQPAQALTTQFSMPPFIHRASKAVKDKLTLTGLGCFSCSKGQTPAGSWLRNSKGA